jgi:hypothetical protein
MLRVTVLAILGVVRLACAQTVFDVASVKPNAECESRRSIHPGKLELMCMTLRRLATMARCGSVRRDREGRPGRVDGANGGPPAEGAAGGALSPESTSQRESCRYAIVTANGGVKLTPTKDGACAPLDLSKPDTLKAGGVYHCGMMREGENTAGETLDADSPRARGPRTPGHLCLALDLHRAATAARTPLAGGQGAGGRDRRRPRREALRELTRSQSEPRQHGAVGSAISFVRCANRSILSRLCVRHLRPAIGSPTSGA